MIDFASATFAGITAVAFGADAPLDADYAIDILGHFDGDRHQIDLSGLFEQALSSTAVNAANVADHIQAVDNGAGQIAILVDADGPIGATAPVKIAVITGTTGADHHTLGTSASDVISVVFDQAQPAAHISISHAG